MPTANDLQVEKLGLSKVLRLVFVFCVATAIASPAQTFTTLLSFNRTNGNGPQASLIQGNDGNLYGTTSGGGASSNCAAGCGTVFKTTASGSLTSLYSFEGGSGESPLGALVQGADGNFYGTTEAGGGNNDGTVFKITPGGALTLLYSFAGSDGGFPFAGLVQASDGNFYGTTSGGGAHNNGTVFTITPTGTLTTLYSFCSQPHCADGDTVFAGLAQADDGTFYGTTASGGANNAGTVFRITPRGALTTLYNFCSQPNCTDGYSANAGLVQANDGNFYGTTAGGGASSNCGSYGCGTVFRITPGGTLTTLHSFVLTDGENIQAGLVQATDGNFYGTAVSGGYGHSGCLPGCGTVFEITRGGTFTALYFFCTGLQLNCPDGDSPDAALVQATDGNFYGVTGAGGSGGNCVSFGGCGTVFKLSTGLTPFVEVQPTSGQVGAPVTILGSNLIGSTSVSFNGTVATFSVVSASEITTTVPTGATTGTVQVTTPEGPLASNTDFQVIGPLQLVPVTPCRLVDTRQTGNPIQGGTSQNLTVPQLGGCGIPTSAAAYSLNVTVVPHGSLGYLTIWPTGEGQPSVSTMNSPDGRVKANAAIVPSGNNAVSVYASDTTDVILDIDGYFAAPGSQTYQFYPLTPCRLVDTRGADGELGGPRLAAQTPRSFPMLMSTCISSGLHPNAYSLNFTVIPNPSDQPLGYLTVWPTGDTQPGVSTLNNPTATVVANAAIVPAGTGGAIDVYPSNTTDLLIDIDGYFAAPGTGGLSLYPVAPCRVLDTRQSGGSFVGEKTVNVEGSACAPPSSAAAYIFNATVVPPGSMPYLTLWPDGGQQPVVSTLNAYDGFITSNMAIVPTTNGSIDAYARGLTQLILDISGYFAP